MRPRLAPSEQFRRRESWRQANASVRLSGGKISREFLELQELHIRGEITREQLRAYIKRTDRDADSDTHS